MQQDFDKGGGRKKLRIAFRLYNEGIWKAEYKGERGDVLYDTRLKNEDGSSLFIKRKDFKTYMSEYFWSALEVYILCENLDCLPFAGGWAEQPAEITTILNLFRVEKSLWDKEQFDKEQDKNR